MDECGNLKHGFLGLRCLFGAHSDENQAELVWSVILQYQIEDSLGYFTLNNASNNSTALRAIQQKLDQTKSLHLQSSPDRNSIHSIRYICGYGHVFNLIVKVFLYGKKSSILAKDKTEKQTIERENEQLE